MTPATNSITHQPGGSGHPYRIDPDQRRPVHPVAGDSLELRVTTPADVAEVVVDIEHDGGLRRLGLTTVDPDDVYGADDDGDLDGHLSAASGARPDLGERRMHRVEITAPTGTFRYRFIADTGPATGWFTTSGAIWRHTGGELRVDGAAPVQPSRVEWLVSGDGPVRCRFDLPLRAEDHVIGFGERFHSLDQRGHTVDARVFEQYKQQGRRTYLPSPFAIVVGDHGWGFHVATSRPTDFDVGNTLADRIIVDVDVDPDDPVVDLSLYTGRPADVLSCHLDDIGPLIRPPDWVFRPWMSGNEWNTQERVLAEVERSIELGIPVGAIVIEAWSDEATFCAFNDADYEIRPDGAPMRLSDFDFPADGRWPDPYAMVERLHELGVKVLLWQIPICPLDRDRDVAPTAAAQVRADATTMVERGFCVREEDGSPYHNRGWWFPGGLLPDWTNPDARAWWLEKRRYLLEDLGIDGFKTDGGEHAWGAELRYADGSRGADTNNRFANDYPTAYHDLLRSAGTDGVTFSRAGFTGAGSLPCHWAGDEDSTWDAFRASITAGLTAAASGIAFWGWDLAGFSGEIPTVELFLRSTAMAALCPIMQYHSEYNHGRRPSNDRTPWNIAERHDDERAITVYREFARLRERLVPYLATEADRTVATGVPLMRPLCFDFDTSTVWNHPTQYMLGEQLLVAPVCWEGLDGLDVYLPPGTWTDVWTGDRHDGDRMVRSSAPLERIPVFATGDFGFAETFQTPD